MKEYGVERLKQLIEKERTTTFWGEKYTGHDVLCDGFLGDGKKLICLTMLNTRPWSHYIRVDSKFDFDDAWESEVFEMLEDCFGDYISMINDEESEYDHFENCPEFPVVDSDSGYCYTVIRWRDIIEAQQ